MRGFTFEQIAVILLAILILVVLIMIVIMQKDQITESLVKIFGTGKKATDQLDQTIESLSSFIIIKWTLTRRSTK